MLATFVVLVLAAFVLMRLVFLQWRIVYLRHMRKRWLATVTDSQKEEHLTPEDLPRFQRVLREARVGFENIRFTYTEPTGYGYVEHREAALIDNLLVRNVQVRNAELASTAYAKIGEAIGAYRMRRNDTVNPVHWVLAVWNQRTRHGRARRHGVNPVHWVLAVWNLPSAVASAFGADKDTTLVRVVQFVYQLLVVLGLVLKAYLEWKP